MVKMTKQDLEWQAQDDARTLITAETVKTDKSRYNKALKEVKNIAKQKEEEAKAALKVAKKPRAIKKK